MGSQQIIASNVKEARSKHGWSQTGLAERAGIDRKTINRLENGHHIPAWGSLSAIARALGMSVHDLWKQTTDEG